MKEKCFLLMLALCFVFFMPLVSAAAQENEAGAEVSREQSAEVTASQNQGNKIGGIITVWLKKIIGYVSQIGSIFGKAAGMRIGGTGITAIVVLVIAKLIEDKAPSWLKWLLYATGGTMFASGSANIAQLIMRHILQ